MLADVLKRFPPFAELDERTLTMAAEHARLIELPANRSLLRRGSRLNRHLYLVEGEVDAVDARGRRRRLGEQAEIYRPGDDVALETRTATRVLSVDIAPIRFALQPTDIPKPEVATVDAWLDRLLASPLVRALPAVTWQRLLRGAEELRVAGGDWLTIEDAVYLIKSGVLARGEATFEAGDFLGEDVAFAGDHLAARTCLVVEDAALLVLPGDAVRALIAEYPFPESPPEGAQTLDLDAVPISRLASEARLLARDRPVVVGGGRAGQRAYALIALTRMGFSATPVTSQAAVGKVAGRFETPAP